MKPRDFLLLVLFLISSVSAKADLMQKASDHYENQLSENEGIIFGEIRGEERSYGHAGVLGKDRDTIDEHSLFEIGSITKTFTGVLLADQVLKGKVQLEDSIVSVLPDDVADEDSPLASVTFLGLATHTSGLPRLPGNLDEGADPNNPYAHYSKKQLYEYLRSFTENDFEEKGVMSYSNLGLGLLGDLLELVSGQSYEDLLREVILDPLQMNETFFQRTKTSIPQEAQDRFATGHRSGTEVSHWQIDALAGAGAIVSSAEDMLRYASAFWSDGIPADLKGALNLSTEAHSDAMGLGWFRQESKVSHDGGTGGFRSSLSIDPAEKFAMIKMENTSSPTISEEVTGDFSSLEGYWTGTLKTPVGELRQVLRISGKGIAYLHSIDQGGAGIRAAVSRFEGEELLCGFPSIGGNFEAKLVEGKLEGTWVQGSGMPLELTRSEEVPPALEEALSKVATGDFSDLEGYWSGYLGGKQGLFVILRFDAIGSSADVGLYSPDQTNAPLPITKVDFSDGTLSLRSRPLNATFEADLDGKTLAGTWNQGTPLPLTLEWSEEKPDRE